MATAKRRFTPHGELTSFGREELDRRTKADRKQVRLAKTKLAAWAVTSFIVLSGLLIFSLSHDWPFVAFFVVPGGAAIAIKCLDSASKRVNELARLKAAADARADAWAREVAMMTEAEIKAARRTAKTNQHLETAAMVAFGIVAVPVGVARVGLKIFGLDVFGG